ncbi:hypothetical protein ACXO5C_08685 [Lactobacillus delbrueckii subsp. bulgaricus]
MAFADRSGLNPPLAKPAPKHMADALAAFKRLLGKLDLQTVMGFGGYYMAGYYFSQAHMSKRNLYFVQALGLLGAGATIGLSS